LDWLTRKPFVSQQTLHVAAIKRARLLPAAHGWVNFSQGLPGRRRWAEKAFFIAT
jgi:hypothetical protein